LFPILLYKLFILN